MQFLKHLNPAFDQRKAVFLAQTKILTLDEAIATIMQDKSRMKLLSDATELLGMQSALAASNLSYSETRKCYNCVEVGHLSRVRPKPPRERETVGREQHGGRGRGRGGRRGGRDGSSGGYRANLTMTEEEKETYSTYSAKEHEILQIWRMKLANDDSKKVIVEGAFTPSSRGNIATYAHSDTSTHAHALASIPTTRASEWIVDSNASRHVTRAHHEFLTYTHLAAPESIQTVDGTAQSVVGKGIVKCTKSMTLSNVLHAPSFLVNLLSISDIILQLKYIVSFNIPMVIFQEKGTGRRLGTGTWHSGL